VPIYRLEIEGDERNARLDGQFRSEYVLNGPDIFACFVLPTEGSPSRRFELDDEVELTQDGTVIAAGLITHVDEEGLGGPLPEFLSRITVTGYAEILQRRHVSFSTSLGSPGSPGLSLVDILSYLVTTFWASDGLTLHPSQSTGPVVKEMAWEDALGTEILNWLAQECGMVWRVDEQKRLRMWAKGDIAAPYNIDVDDVPAKYFGDIRVSKARFEGYANRVIVKGQKQTILEYGETVTSTGTETVFTATQEMIGFRTGAVKVTNVPSLGVALDDVKWETARLVGGSGDPIWEVDTDAGTFTRLDGALPSGAIIRLIYDAEVSPRGEANDLTDQATSPIRDEVVQAQVTTDADAQDLAEQILPYFVAAKDKKPRFSTFEDGIILPGQTLTMDVPERDISGTVMVTRVTLRYQQGDDNEHLVREVETTQGEILKGDWRDLLNQFVIGPSATTNVVNSGGAGSSGTVTTNPDGDGGSGSNLSIPPDDTDVFFNKKGAIGTHRADNGVRGIRVIHQDDADIAAGGSPGSADRMQLLLTALSNASTDSLLKLRSPDGTGVLTVTPYDATYPAEVLYGAELVDGVYVARSEAVLTLGVDLTGAVPVAALNLYVDQVIGDPMNFSNLMQFSIRHDPTSPWSGGLIGVGSTTLPALFQCDVLALRDTLGTGTSWGLGILASDSFTAHRQLRINMGDQTRTINFDASGFVKWT
jgi:hypothetical protein